MGCGCKNKNRQNQNIHLEIKDSNPILLDESLISQLGRNNSNTNSTSTSKKVGNFFCKIQGTDYNSEVVSLKIHNTEGTIVEEIEISKYDSLEKFVKIVLDFEKNKNIPLTNKQCIASEIASHTYVHKVIKKALDEYTQHKISLLMFQNRIQAASNLSYDNSPDLVAEFEHAKKLLGN